MEHVNASTFKDVILILASLTALGFLVWKSVRPSRIEPQPVEVADANRFITRDYHDTCYTSIEGRVSRVEAEVLALRHEMREDREISTQRILTEVKSVHERVNKVDSSLAGLKGRVEQLIHDS